MVFGCSGDVFFFGVLVFFTGNGEVLVSFLERFSLVVFFLEFADIG